MHFAAFEEFFNHTDLSQISTEELRLLYQEFLNGILSFKPELIDHDNKNLLVSMLSQYKKHENDLAGFISRDFSLLSDYCQLIPFHIENSLPLTFMPHCHKLIMHTADVEVYFLCIALARIVTDIQDVDNESLEFLVNHCIPFVKNAQNDYDHPWALMIFLRKHPSMLLHNKILLDYIFRRLKKHINRRVTVTDITTECIDPVLTQLFEHGQYSDEICIDALEGFFSLIGDLNEELPCAGGDRSALLTAGIRLIIEGNSDYFKTGRFEDFHEAAEVLIVQMRHLYQDATGDINYKLIQAAEKLLQEDGYNFDKYSPDKICTLLKKNMTR